MSERILALMGPTASGKSSLAEKLAERFDGELISVDSALVYRGLAIGAAKPDYPHHLVHLRDPVDPYTAADFARDAALLRRSSRGATSHHVGGSMLYFRALIHGLDDIPTIDPAIRAAIENEARELGGQRCIVSSQRWTPPARRNFIRITVSVSVERWRCIVAPVHRSVFGSAVRHLASGSI